MNGVVVMKVVREEGRRPWSGARELLACWPNVVAERKKRKCVVAG